MRFFNTFRGRLLLILAVLLIATLGVQYYLNLRTQNENTELREKQEQAIAAGFALGLTGMTAEKDRLQDFVDVPGQRFLDENARERIRDIIIIDNEWKIIDSLDPELLPVAEENGDVTYKHLPELTSLPPLVEDSRLNDDLKYFPNKRSSANKFDDDEAHAIPIETSKGRWYVMVLIKNHKSESAWRAAQPLVYTLGTLVVSSLITFLLVWRFARPIANLSNAAREVAEGNLKVRVPDAHRYDEMGRLALNFNEMAAELEKTRELQAQLQQAEKSAVVGRLGSAIAHEIRNPLNYINLTLDHLRSKYAPADEEKKATFDKLTLQLKGEVARINQQISDFLNYSRPAKADLKPVGARKVIEDSLRIAEAEAEEKNVTIGIVEHENVPEIMGDPEFLRSVFNNLFINAIQSMESTGGHLGIKISPDENGEFVNFEITDTGNGISPENLSKIFEPYFSTKETGTGLGLAIVQKIVETHNGKIEVESAVGAGTKFTVKLPKADN
ncbi:MAG TPA: ATP-binding protein [Pyrinomonadaceae bacterium]|nr:HAMP domain-containing protein [Acidobacteriota bacterium]HQZ97725.1 ATP-binding protein [Pyrinomonadaceae bacterium]